MNAAMLVVWCKMNVKYKNIRSSQVITLGGHGHLLCERISNPITAAGPVKG